MSTTNEKIQNAYLSSERERQIQALINLQASGTLDHAQINLMLHPTSYALRNMQLAWGNLSLTTTARLLGTYVITLFELLRESGVLGPNKAGEILPLNKYIDLGYFVVVPEQFRCGGYHRFPEFLVTPQGRRWLHYNAAMGWLDYILTRSALQSRAPWAANLPVPLPDHGPKLS